VAANLLADEVHGPASTAQFQAGSDSDLSPLPQQFRTLLQQFASGNIVLYPLDARDLVTLNSEAADAHINKLLLQLEKGRVQTSQATMETMAKMTGGKTCYNKNEIVSCIRDASHESEQYYLLSYYRNKKNSKPGWRKLTVKVNQPDVDVPREPDISTAAMLCRSRGVYPSQ
jgi:VWFA-related protein